MATTAPTYDPINTATKLATDAVASRKAQLALQTSNANATGTALTKLSSAMSAFESSLATLTAKKSLVANTALLSGGVGTATASATAVGGTYSFYVEQLATAGQVAYGGITDTAVAGPSSLTVTLADGTPFIIDLVSADKQPDGVLTAKEIAAAINTAAANIASSAAVTASTMTMPDGTQTLILTNKATGANATDVAIDASGVADPALAATLGALPTVMVAAQNARIWVGPKSANISIEQSTNTFTVVDDVKMTFTKAQPASEAEAPATLTVAADSSATNANVQGFVDAFNKLNAVLDEVSNTGDPAKGVPAGILSSDSGINLLRTQMAQMLRTKIGTSSMTLLGITAQRDGSLALNTSRLSKALETDPTALDTVFGSASLTAPTGVMGGMDTLLSRWTSSVLGTDPLGRQQTGQIKARRASLDRLQQSLVTKQRTLDTQYDSAYTRYLSQFTRLQTMQSQMNTNTSLFDALFSNDKN